MKRLGIILLWAATLVLVGLLTARVSGENSDKGPIVFVVGYGSILIVEFVLWGILKIVKSAFSKPVGWLVLLLLILLIPLLNYVTYY